MTNEHNHDTTEIEVVEQKALTFPEQAEQITILSPEDYKGAATFLKGIKAMTTQIEDHHKPFIQAAYTAHKEAKAAEKKFTGPLKDAERIVKRKMADWTIAEERRKQAEIEKRRKELDKAGHKDMPVEPQPDKTKVEGVTTRKVLKWRIKNESKIKKEFMMVNSTKINSLVNAMGKDAEKMVGAGAIEVYEDVQISGRRQ